MNHFEAKSTGRGPQQIGQPVERVIATAAGGEGLVVFVKSTDQRHDDDCGDENPSPLRWPKLFPAEISAEQATAAEEKAEVLKLVEIRQRRSEICAERA